MITVPSMQAAKLMKRYVEDCSQVFARRAAWLACIRCHNVRVVSRSKCSTVEFGTADRNRRPKVPCNKFAMCTGHAFPSRHRLPLSTQVHAGSCVFLEPSKSYPRPACKCTRRSRPPLRYVRQRVHSKADLLQAVLREVVRAILGHRCKLVD